MTRHRLVVGGLLSEVVRMFRFSVVLCLLVALVLAGCASDRYGRAETSVEAMFGSVDTWLDEHPTARAATYTAAYAALVVIVVTAVVVVVVL